MRELRNTKIIAVDHGYGNMKTSKHRHPQRQSKPMKLNQSSPGNILEYNGIYYRIGEDTKNLSG